jgi:RNA-binding protein YhbY
MSAQIAHATKSEVVEIIGNIAIFYRQHPDPQKRKLKSPKLSTDNLNAI